MARTTKRKECLLISVDKQPYIIPANWCWISVGSINQYKSECVEPKKQPNRLFELYSVPSSAENYPEIVFGKEIGSTKQAVEKGDVLLCKINPRINRVWEVSQHTNHDLLASSEWIIIRNHKINSSYLMYCFRSPYFRDYMLTNVSGVGGSLMRAQPKYVKEYPLPLPPFAEQQRIVDRIESLFAKLDEAKEKAQSVVDGFENRKAAILHKAFTGELTAEWRRKHKKEFACYRMSLSQLCSKITDGTHHSPQNGLLGDVMYVTAKNIKESGIDLTNITFVSQDVHDEIYSRCDVKYGDVLYIKDGATTGIATVNNISEPFSLLSSVAVLRPKDDSLRSRYLSYALNSRDIKNEMLGKMTGVAITRLTLTKIKKSEIPVFPIEEQDIIIQLLDCLLDKEQQAKEAAGHVIEKIETIKKSILARAFRGELGTNDPTDEPAEELLKRVL